MKARDELKKNLLGTLFAAATKDGKAPDDAAVLRTIRSFVKSLDETVSLLAGAGPGYRRATRGAGHSRGLPAAGARRGRACTPASPRSWPRLPERSPKAMGQVMAALKARHGDALDSKIASGLVRAALAERAAPSLLPSAPL